MIIAVDFDGTCVTHEYPGVGRDIGAQKVLRELVRRDHLLLLWTIRSGARLDDAVRWFDANEIPLFGVNFNVNQKSWSLSPKAYAHLYIDDAAFGAPLILDAPGERPYLDWKKVAEVLL